MEYGIARKKRLYLSYIYIHVYTKGNLVIYMSKISVRVPEDLKKKMERHKEVNWSEVVRESIQDHLTKLELVESISSRSKLSEEEAEEIGEKIKKGIAERHGLIK